MTADPVSASPAAAREYGRRTVRLHDAIRACQAFLRAQTPEAGLAAALALTEWQAAGNPNDEEDSAR